MLGYPCVRIAIFRMPRRCASCTHRIASASGDGMFVKVYAPSPIEVTLQTHVWGIRAAVANGFVTWPKREMPPTIAFTFSSVIARWIAVLAWPGSSPISTRTSSYWYFVPLRSDFAISTALRNEFPRKEALLVSRLEDLRAMLVQQQQHALTTRGRLRARGLGFS